MKEPASTVVDADTTAFSSLLLTQHVGNSAHLSRCSLRPEIVQHLQQTIQRATPVSGIGSRSRTTTDLCSGWSDLSVFVY